MKVEKIEEIFKKIENKDLDVYIQGSDGVFIEAEEIVMVDGQELGLFVCVINISETETIEEILEKMALMEDKDDIWEIYAAMKSKTIVKLNELLADIDEGNITTNEIKEKLIQLIEVVM